MLCGGGKIFFRSFYGFWGYNLFVSLYRKYLETNNVRIVFLIYCCIDEFYIGIFIILVILISF